MVKKGCHRISSKASKDLSMEKTKKIRGKAAKILVIHKESISLKKL